MLSSTEGRVQANTPSEINERIHRRTEESVERLAHADEEEIARRLEDLDQEWDIERSVEAMAPIFTLLGIGLGLGVSRKWFALPIFVQTFFLQHAIQGWCPPIPVLRYLGVRTTSEIHAERHALKALRGDYTKVLGKGSHGSPARRALKAAER